MAGGRPKEFDTPEVLQRAMELFWRQGYAAVSLPELLRAMGISRQSLYDTFGSKRELYIGAIEHYRATQLSLALALLEREGSPVENVRSVVGFFEDLAADTRCRGSCGQTCARDRHNFAQPVAAATRPQRRRSR
jgi:TetR/AcrR family transcriptional repressor of nem operon